MLIETGDIDLANPVNRAHALNRQRIAWWLTLPGLAGGNKFYDLMQLNHGTLTNGPTWSGTTRPGGFGHLNFDGSNDFVVSAGNGPSGAGQISYAIWMRSTTTSADAKHILNIGAATNDNMAFFIHGNTASPGKLKWGAWGTADKVSAVTVADGVWHRAMVTYTGAAMTLYLDGKVDSTSVYSALNITAATVYIGEYRGGGGFYYTGSLDDISIWSRALSAAEVFADYDLSRRGYPDALNRY